MGKPRKIADVVHPLVRSHPELGKRGLISAANGAPASEWDEQAYVRRLPRIIMIDSDAPY